MNNWNKGPDNGKSVSEPNQTYIVDTPMDPNHENGEIRPRSQKWAGLGGGRSWAFSRFDTPQGVQIKLFCYKRFSKNLKRMNMVMECTFWKYYSLGELITYWGLEGIAKSKVSKMLVLKTCIFCTKSTITRRFVTCRQNFISYLDSPDKITLISVIKSID